MDCLTLHRNSWIVNVTADGTELVLTDAQGKSLENQELFLEIFKQLHLPTCPKTFFQQVKRAFNIEAKVPAAQAADPILGKIIKQLQYPERGVQALAASLKLGKYSLSAPEKCSTTRIKRGS